MKKIIFRLFKVVRAMILGLLLIYVVNVSLNVVNVFIPINWYSIIVVGVLGIPGMLSLIIMSLII